MLHEHVFPADDTWKGVVRDSEYRAWLDNVAADADAAAHASLDGEGVIEFKRVTSESWLVGSSVP